MQDNTMPNQPAFPQPVHCGSYGETGMTLRDYFAAKVMLGQINAVSTSDRAWDRSYEEIATNAYQMADALLAERSKTI